MVNGLSALGHLKLSFAKTGEGGNAMEFALYNKSMRPKVYVETSVISYLTARSSRDIIVAANQQATQEWWHTRKPDFEIYISQLVIQEANSGDMEAILKGRRFWKT